MMIMNIIHRLWLRYYGQAFSLCEFAHYVLRSLLKVVSIMHGIMKMMLNRHETKRFNFALIVKTETCRPSPLMN
jgi:hypothetical protein